MIANPAPTLSLQGQGSVKQPKATGTLAIDVVFADFLAQQPIAANGGKHTGTTAIGLPEGGKDLPVGKPLPASGKDVAAGKAKTDDTPGESTGADLTAQAVPAVAPPLPFAAPPLSVASDTAALTRSRSTRQAVQGHALPKHAAMPVTAPLTPAQAATSVAVQPLDGKTLPPLMQGGTAPATESTRVAMRVALEGKDATRPVVVSATARQAITQQATAPQTSGRGTQDGASDPAIPVAARDGATPADPTQPMPQAIAAPLAHPGLPQPAQAQAAPAAMPRTEAPERIDFAQLVDSIARAREHADARPVQISLDHAEFGAVSLKFRHEGDALSVQMTSVDPGFARAVASTQTADSGQMQQDTSRQDRPSHGESAQGQLRTGSESDASRSQHSTQTAGQMGTPSQSQGQPRQQGQRGATANPSPANAAQHGRERNDTSGRFA